MPELEILKRVPSPSVSGERERGGGGGGGGREKGDALHVSTK